MLSLTLRYAFGLKHVIFCLFLETTLTATLESMPLIEHLFPNALAASGNPPEAAPEDSLNCTETGAATADNKEHEMGNTVSSSQAEEGMVVVSDKTEEQQKTQDEEDIEMEASAAETGTLTRRLLSDPSINWAH